MEKPKPKEDMLKIPSEVTSVRLISFSFVPAVKKLPSEGKVGLEERERQLMRRSNEYVGKQKEAAAGQTMSGDGVFKADFVYVGGDVDEVDPGARRARQARETTFRPEAPQLKLSAEQGQLSQITGPSESAAFLSLNTIAPIKHAVLETANDKHRSTDVRGCDTSFGSKVSPGLLFNQVPDRRMDVISNHGLTHSAELLGTPASSRESVLSEDWFGSRGLSSVGSPASLSRTISPCSSVRSGAFSPSVVRIKRHCLAPGSSLAWNLQPCLSPASHSPTPSGYSMSCRIGGAWHRPPPTQLTLLTAILRKGRLPILSSAQQRAYSPCWPISAVSLSSCRACNAAAKLALICPGVARSHSQAAVEVPQMGTRDTPMHGIRLQPLRCLTPPPSPDLSECTTIGPPTRSQSQLPKSGLRPDSAWQRVTSPTQQSGVTSSTQKGHAASPVSHTALVTRADPAVQNVPSSKNSQETLPLMSNILLSSSFLRLRSQSPKSSSSSTCASGDCPVLSTEPKTSQTPEAKHACTPESKSACTPQPKSTCTPESKLACTPQPKSTCITEPKFACTTEPKSACTPQPKSTCTPESKLACTPQPKSTCITEPKLACTPESKLTCTSGPRCDAIASSPAPSPVPKLTIAQVPSCNEAQCLSLHQTGIKISPLSERPHPQPPSCHLSVAPWTPTLSPSPSTSPCTLGVLSPLPDSHSSTPDRLSPSPSLLTSSRDLLTPSPSLSFSVSPSCSPVPKSISDRTGRKRKYKIKSSYKALAAIPTNTLLLDQQAIDDEVEKEGCPLEADVDKVTETRSEMCSPAQLRQQSEELYAAIDQVLQDPLPMRRSQSAPQSLVTLADADVPRRLTPIPRSAGRETKYATFHLQSSGCAERNLTKPGVIRPVTVIPKLTEDDEEEDFPNPFRQQYLKEVFEEQGQKFVSTPVGQIAQVAEDHRKPGSPTFGKEDIQTTDEMVLLITEKEETSTPPLAEGSSKLGPVSFNPAQMKTGVHETHI